MKGKYPTKAASGLTRLALPIIFAALLMTLQTFERQADARQAGDLTPSTVTFAENFNTSVPPALPAGWTAAQTGSNSNFATVAASTANATISAFTNNPGTAGSSELVSVPIAVNATASRLTFRHQYITEVTPGYDGGVLEISVAGGPFQDIVAAGGSFLSGGYTQAILADATGNPLIGRQTWTGTSSGYLTTVVNLPMAALGQSVRLKWRYGTDEIVAGQGWWIDDIQISLLNSLPPGISYTFTNSSSITIPDSGPGSPYPSTINVTNIPTQLAKVTVRLNSMNHTFTSDIDVLLVGPEGQTAVLMSDVGGGADLNGTTITLDDEASAPLPTLSAVLTGTYLPTNSGVTDIFPAPAPTQSGGTALSIFSGTNPNGAWRLFLVDDAGADSGSMAGGWTLTLTAAISGQNTNAISIPDSGMASPYPSEINITDHTELVSRVQVNINNFSHGSADDVDILLQSPSGRSVVLMSDAGGANAINNLTLSFDDSAGATLPDNTAISSGLYKPTDHEPGDTFPAPAGPPTGRMLSSLNGTVANGAWKLFIVDDSGNNVGNIDGGWSILVGTTAGTVTVTGSGVAAPYPTQMTVSGLPGSITKATVSIQNFSHLSPDDVDILLVGPDGRRIVLMSDAGGQSEVGALNLTFDDMAANPIPDDGPLGTGTYRPADYEPGEVFPSPAPAGPPTGATLGAFYGGVPNGIWQLFVVGDGGTSFGSIAGSWSVTLQTSTSACLFTLSPMVQAFPVTGGSGTFGVTQPNGCAWSATTSDPFITITSGSSGGGNGSVGFTVGANQGPARTGTVDVTNGVVTRTFQVQQPSGCPLGVSHTTINFAGGGGPGSIGVVAGAACSWQGSTISGWIQVTSQPQNGDGTLTFNVLPNPARTPRSATIDIGSSTINVNQAPSRTSPFDFDGDARTDVSVYRPSAGTWWISRSSQPGTATAQQFGIAADRLAPADFDGDQKTDIAVYRDGVWYVLKSSDGSVLIYNWGTAGDVPVPSDYDSDASAEVAVFRPSSGTWWILYSNGTFSSTAFGISSDIPTPGDYDGDGRTDISVYRGAATAGGQGTWWIINSSTGMATSTTFGVQNDVPVPGDYDGDGRDGIAVYRPSTGFWYRSTDPSRNYDGVQWGIAGDLPIAGDYDGDGKADPAVVRSGAAVTWHILGSTSGALTQQFGVPGDKAVPRAYIP